MAGEPTEGEEDGAREKDAENRRVGPGGVEVFGGMEQGPAEEGAGAEVLEDLGGLLGYRRQRFFGGLQRVEVGLDHSDPFG